MSAGRSMVAASICGVILWAFKREAERAQGQGDATLIKTSITPPQRPSIDRKALLGGALDYFSNLAQGKGQSADANTGSILGGLIGGSASSRAPSGSSGGVNALLAMIRSKEAPRGYDDYYRGSKIAPPKRLTTMTIGEVLNWQKRSVSAGSKSSAAGGYQFIRKTLQSLVTQGHAGMGELFSPAVQDRMAIALLNRRGLQSYQAGKITPETFANNLAKEWASFPVVTGSKKGRSYYAGDGLNQALIGVDPVMQAVRSI